jgi:putative Mg2+ transporter-C (MgtC) family protein
MLTAHDITMMISVLAAFLLGAVVGWERQVHNRTAGLRTHMLVAAGSASFTVVSIYGFAGLGTTSDPSRLAAQIVTGIGFLGAGVIFRGQDRVHGLTTAASIWMVSALGVMCGVGMYWLAGFVTLLTWIALWALKLVEQRFEHAGAALQDGEEL